MNDKDASFTFWSFFLFALAGGLLFFAGLSRYESYKEAEKLEQEAQQERVRDAVRDLKRILQP